MRQVRTCHVPEFHSFQVAPYPFIWVEVGGIPRQSFKPYALRSTSGEELFDVVIMMDRRPIPDDQKLPGDMPQQVAQKANDISSLVGPLLSHDVQLARRGNGTDGGHMIPSQELPEDGRLPLRCIGPHDSGRQVEP